jgi:hypothetical protein
LGAVDTDIVKHALEDVAAARDIIRANAVFQEWAQQYLDSGRWAGHDRADAIKTELLERDRELATLRETHERLRAATTYLIDVRDVRCLHTHPAPDADCAKCRIDSALPAQESHGTR